MFEWAMEYPIYFMALAIIAIFYLGSIIEEAVKKPGNIRTENCIAVVSKEEAENIKEILLDMKDKKERGENN